MLDTVLVVDDEPDILELCAEALAGPFSVRTAASASQAMGLLEAGDIDIVLTDMMMPQVSGLDLLRHIKAKFTGIDVILMTGHATVDTAVEALKAGAFDYLTKPFAIDDLINRVSRLAERRELVVETCLMREQIRSGQGISGLIGTAAPMQAMYRLILKVAPRIHPVLITGDSGTGKELVARAIHVNGLNPGGPFVPLDCGAFSATLIESELFGHVPGAFTGASHRRQGLLASAGKGTLFLDEIGELPLDLQAKLLRAIQEREFRALGSNERERFEARIVAATNRDLEAFIGQGKFRQDLYFRLNVLSIRVPPLRERSSDIAALAQYFIDRQRQPGDTATGISREALSILMRYPWPGNVRELRNQVERALVLCDTALIQACDLDLAQHAIAEAPTGLTKLEEVERRTISSVLEAAGGHRTKAAKLLGIGKTTLYKKLKDYGLDAVSKASL